MAHQLRERIGDRPLYISVDIDVLDPAYAPGTGTPEAGGLTSRELLEILRGLADCRLVSADLVEVAPAYDPAEITSVAASHTAYELVTIMARQIGAAREATGEEPAKATVEELAKETGNGEGTGAVTRAGHGV